MTNNPFDEDVQSATGLKQQITGHRNRMSASNLNETQREWHHLSNEEVMGELAHYNKTFVRVCALEPIVEAWTKQTWCIQ